MKLVEEQSKFAKDVSDLINFIFNQGYFCSLGEVLRTKEQAELYAKEGKGIKDSLHCEKLAIDINLFDENLNYLQGYEHYQKLGDYWESLDKQNRWGGYFVSKYHGHIVDMDHYERKPE